MASRYYADYRQGFSEAELVKAGAEAEIPPEFIQQAIQEVQDKQQQQLERQKRVKRQRQQLLILGAGFLSLTLFWSTGVYNTFSRVSARSDAAWAQVENQLQRRADVLPALIDVTQSHAVQEQSLVTKLTQARQSYLQAETVDEKEVAIERINQAIDQFYDYAAVHPELKANDLFVNLQYEIAGTENRLAVERMRYNQAVQDYNQTIQTFPNSVLAKAFNFQSKPYFRAENRAEDQ
ncbi:LemA family protein [Leptolyngbya ohadii]|uniref:LemA family protein n=1 Tax=Leptolyngbya ohadii TaxID=1962290 RepID=UPI0019D44113|nr:LemA family protein [Leptolyngbya ohadii]